MSMPHHHRFLLILYPAQGYINPTFQLAKRLITLGAHVTLCTTLHMHRRMSKSNNLTLLPGLSFLPFSDGFDDGLKLTSDADFSHYTSELKRRGSQFLTDLILSTTKEGHPFTCLIYTPILHWAAEAARAFHLPTALLWTQPATVLYILYYFFNNNNTSSVLIYKNKEPELELSLPGLPFSLAPCDLPSFLLPLMQNSCFFRSYKEQLHELDLETNPVILVNSFEALEPEAMRVVREFNMIPIGPLIADLNNDASFNGNDIEWLDSKAEKSVVYVSFGTFVVLPKTQMEEIARALLDSGHPFLWVISEHHQEGLSCIDELELKGKIVTWCSQLDVVSHPSVGCFFTHCGWNSTMESLVSGVPMLAFPQWIDQKTNAKLVEDVWKIGVRVDHRANEDGVVLREEVSKCLEEVMGKGEKAEEMRRNAEKWKSLAKEASMGGGTSDKNLRTFLQGITGSESEK